uniref:Uncharacterized protein n=1 Tax=Rhizophora mucronata TaxID=61149 RepID=A0A2P2QWP4_RHIMU
MNQRANFSKIEENKKFNSANQIYFFLSGLDYNKL